MEQQTAAIQKEKEAFQQEAIELAKRLEAVIHDKFVPKSHIDADTPIDKTLDFLHAFVAVSPAPDSGPVISKLPGRDCLCVCVRGSAGARGPARAKASPRAST